MLTSSTTRGLAPRCREQDPLSSWSCMLHTTIPREIHDASGVWPRGIRTQRTDGREKRGGEGAEGAVAGRLRASLAMVGGRVLKPCTPCPKGECIAHLQRRGRWSRARPCLLGGRGSSRDYRELWAPSGGEGGDGHWRRWSQACIRGRCTIGRRGARGGPRGPARAGGQEAGE